jgi:hypothetical protein
MWDNVLSLHDNVLSLQDNVLSLHDNVLSLQDNVLSLQDNVLSLQENVLSLQEPHGSFSEKILNIQGEFHCVSRYMFKNFKAGIEAGVWLFKMPLWNDVVWTAGWKQAEMSGAWRLHVQLSNDSYSFVISKCLHFLLFKNKYGTWLLIGIFSPLQIISQNVYWCNI